jgi:rhodanese-related sulfurtransferase
MNIAELLKNKNTTVIDVRTPFEFDDQHFEGAINIPLDEVPEQLEQIKEMSKPIILYCRSGARSGSALNWLRMNGVEDIHNAGGLSDMLIYQMNA